MELKEDKTLLQTAGEISVRDVPDLAGTGMCCILVARNEASLRSSFLNFTAHQGYLSTVLRYG